MYNDIKVFEKYKEVRAGFGINEEHAWPRRLAIALEAKKKGGFLFYPGIIHSVNIEVVESPEGYSEEEPGLFYKDDLDGSITNRKGIVLTTSTGDCLAVFAYDPVKKVIGLAHAGWRGVLTGMPAKLIEKMSASYGCAPQDIDAWIGPGIGLCCFEVSEDVAEDFWGMYPWCEEYTIDLGNGKYKIDLKGISLELLEMTGVGHAEASDECTCCQPERFWSCRRCKDKQRMVQYIELI